MTRNRLNLRKMIAAAICLAGSVTLFAQETGVVINGVTWATRNVDTFRTFAPNPESAGMFYQWNRPTAWATTGSVTGWDSSTPTGTTWETANDPSPSGWHVPTKADFDKLLDTTKVDFVWTTLSGVNGYRFTDIATSNSIFLPVVNARGINGSLIWGPGANGYYWISTEKSSTDAQVFLIDNSGTVISYGDKATGISVRPVKDPSVTTYNITATAGTGGSISPSDTISVEEGKDTTFTFSANSGYEISQVLIDNLNNFPAVSAGSYTFNNVTANHTIEVYFSPITGISEATAEKIQIFPNPTRNVLNFSIAMPFEITDIQGKVLLMSNKAVKFVNISRLPSGIYFVKLKTDKGIVTKKFVKE